MRARIKKEIWGEEKNLLGFVWISVLILYFIQLQHDHTFFFFFFGVIKCCRELKLSIDQFNPEPTRPLWIPKIKTTDDQKEEF